MNKIKSAYIKPLKGKYYGTQVNIIIDAGDYVVDKIVEIWIGDDHEPSLRQLEQWDGYAKETGEMLSNDELIREFRCDNHFESAMSYHLAKLLVDTINMEAGHE